MIQSLNDGNVFGAPVVTEVTPLGVFHPAEDYHQGYFRNNPSQPYCQAVVLPKVQKFLRKFGGAPSA